MRIIRASLVPVMLATTAAAQSLERRIAAAPDGEVRLTFAASPGVLGDGAGRIAWDCDGDRCQNGWRGRDQAACEPGPVRVALRRRDGAVVRVTTRVGGAWPPAGTGVTDLGVVAAPDAARYLLDLARRDRGTAGADAILPAALADSITVWPTLLALARERDVPQRARRQAIFWVGQAAESAATAGLTELLDYPHSDREIQQAAVFALSQRPADEGIPVLLDVARTHRDPGVRRAALFWLAQSGDARALALFEELLTRS
jgi:hypothetical protein